MKKVKKVGALCLCILCIIGLITGYYMSGNWMIRFRPELNRFFGEGNWKCISKETKKSIIYTENVRIGSSRNMSREVPGKFKNWYIRFENKDGKDEIWSITNHTLKINHDKYGFLSPKRYTNKQALILELMDISFGVIGEEIFNEMIRSELSENEANCIDVTVSYHGGNPKPKFYDALSKETWFTVDRVTAEDYLACELHDFYLYIRAYDYKLKKLTEQERQNVFDSLESIERNLLKKYGENASFEIYFDKDNNVEYIDGRKQSQ